jgi:hypothetical protein
VKSKNGRRVKRSMMIMTAKRNRRRMRDPTLTLWEMAEMMKVKAVTSLVQKVITKVIKKYEVQKCRCRDNPCKQE